MYVMCELPPGGESKHCCQQVLMSYDWTDSYKNSWNNAKTSNHTALPAGIIACEK